MKKQKQFEYFYNTNSVIFFHVDEYFLLIVWLYLSNTLAHIPLPPLPHHWKSKLNSSYTSLTPGGEHPHLTHTPRYQNLYTTHTHHHQQQQQHHSQLFPSPLDASIMVGRKKKIVHHRKNKITLIIIFDFPENHINMNCGVRSIFLSEILCSRHNCRVEKNKNVQLH